MGSIKPPSNGAYLPHELAVLGEAFSAVWATISAHRPYSNDADNEILKAAVSERLCQIASVIGATDVQQLRSATLESFSFRPDA